MIGPEKIKEDSIMKKNILFSSMAVIILMTASCKKSELTSTNQNVQKYTYTCTLDDEGSKVAVSDAGKVTWQAGDVICVHNGIKAYELITLKAEDISNDGKSVTITTTVTSDSEKPGIYASYPGEDIPSGWSKCYDYCYASDTNQPIIVAELNGNVFNMKNAVGGITFSVSGDFDSYEFSGNNGEVIGYDGVCLRGKKGYEGRTYDDRNGTALKQIAGSISDGKVSLYVIVSYINSKLVLDFNSGFTIKFFKGGECKKMVTTSKTVTLHRNEILALGDVTSHLKDYAPPTIPADEPIFDSSKATDLSIAECANCYIISAKGDYIFKAVKGNDKKSPLEGAQNAVVLWETYNNDETVVKNSIVAKTACYEGNIQVQMPETIHAGNAVIAVKNGNGDILWSWHIWVPATDITTNTYSLFNTELMDRNLGALVAATAGDGPCDVESFGLIYQWGRKDPFVGPKSTSSSSNASVAGMAMNIASGQISIAESIKNPTLYGFCDGGHWATDTELKLWTNSNKTLYDPCPAGYRVPNRDTNQPLFKTITEQEGWAVSEGSYWITVGNPATVFPVSGYRDDSSPASIAKVHKRVAIWSAHRSSSDPYGVYHLNWRPGDSSPSFACGTTSGSRGGYIRCVKTN